MRSRRRFVYIIIMVGNHTRVKVVKNKVAPPFKQAEFDIMFGTGISREGDILDLAAECSIVNKSGAWYAYEGDKIGQGRENAKLFLREHPEIRDEIEKKVRVHYHLDPADETAEAAVQAERAAYVISELLSARSTFRVPVYAGTIKTARNPLFCLLNNLWHSCTKQSAPRKPHCNGRQDLRKVNL